MVKLANREYWLKATIISSIIAAILLVIANSSVWVNNYIFNTSNFTQVATSSLTSEDSRQAIARRITNEALKDRPIINNLAGDTATNIISGALNTDLANKALSTAISKMQILVTSEQRESVVINLEGVKTFLHEIVQVAGKYRNIQVDTSNIPSQIVLINQETIPNFYAWSIVFLWLGPIALIMALALFAYPYFVNRFHFRQILIVQGLAIILAGLLSLLLGPLFRPQLLSNFTDPDGRAVVENLFNSFLATFNNQTTMLIIFGFVASAVGGGLTVWNRRKLAKR